jgi:hypothetical protein
MTPGYSYPRARITDEEAGWLEEARAPEVKQIVHSCGNCRTPYGRSALPCPNDPARAA